MPATAKALWFGNVQEMKDYLDTAGWKRR